MESPTKRRRLFEAEDPDIQLHERRARNDKKLKSRFESIFEKYSKDFSDVGDVIDFTNDQIVVDNGHIRNMAGEDDPGDEDGCSDDDGGVTLSPPSVAERPCSDVVPNSQDLESSDDDPLGLPEHVVGPTVSSFSQEILSSPLKGRTSQSQDRKQPSLNAGWNFNTLPSLQNNSSIEEAWQVPPLPEDVNVQPPSPSPSLQHDSDSARSASPPGISIWAPVANRRRFKASDTHETRRITWTTDENERLRHYRTSTDLTFEDICNHFPGRTSKSLQQRWQILKPEERSVKQTIRRNAWTQEEDQLLHRLKTSTDKTFPEIQSELTRHPINAVQMRWYMLRQKFKHSLEENDVPSFDLSNLPSPGNSVVEGVSCAPDATNVDKQPWLDLSHSPIECNPQRTEAEREETLNSLRQLVSDPSVSCSEDELGGPKRFPSDMIIPDSQSCDGPHHLSSQPLNLQARPRKSSTRPRIHEHDIVLDLTSLPFSHVDSASGTFEPKTYSTDRQSPQRALYPLKRKRILDNGENNGQILPKPNVSPKPSARQQSSNTNYSRLDDSQCNSSPVSESPFSPEEDLNDAKDTGSYSSNLATSDSHQEYPLLNLSPLCSELVPNKVKEYCPDMKTAETTSESPAQAVIPYNSDKGRNYEIIEITSSPLSHIDSTESQAQQSELDRYSKTTSTNKVLTNQTSDESSMFETNDERYKTLCTTVAISDGSRLRDRQTPELSTNEDGSMQKPIVACADGLTDPALDESIISTGERVSVEEQLQTVHESLSNVDLPSGAGIPRESGQGPTTDGDSAEIQATKADMPITSSTRVETPIGEALQQSTAERTPCQRFYRVEIPKPSHTDSISSRAAPEIQAHFLADPEIHPVETLSEDGGQIKPSQGSINQEAFERRESPDLTTGEENHESERQIQPLLNASNLLSPTIERQATGDVEAGPTAIQPSDNHQNSNRVSSDKRGSTAHDLLPSSSSPSPKQDVINEDDEDDLHLFTKPAVTLGMGKPAQQMKIWSTPHLALRPAIDDADMSDDELSTPIKVTQQRIEMTPVRSLMMMNR